MPRTRASTTLAASLTAGLLALTSALTACSPTAESKPEQDLTLAILASPPSLEPSAVDDGSSAFIWQGIFDTLLYIDNEGKLQPNAAESWNLSEDGRTLTLKLRKGMTFGSGSPVSSEAVKKTFEHTMSTPGVNQGKFSAVESVSAEDEQTVVVHFKRPDGAFLTNLALAPGIIGDPTTMGDKSKALRPVGSGPYVLDEGSTTDGSTYVLKKRDDYWNAGAYPFDKLTVRVVTDATATFNALQAGEIDAATVQAAQAPAIEAAGYKLTAIDANSLGSIAIMDRAGEILPPLADVRVRQAINMAFDRAGFVSGALKGKGIATQQIFNPKSAAFSKDLNETYSYDVEGARKLLAEAGYPDGFSATLPSTFLSAQLEPLITQALSEIGVKVTWEPVPAQDVATVLASKKYPMAFFIRALSLPARDVLDYYGKSGYLNPFSPADSELDSMMEQAATTTDPNALNDAYQRINRYGVEKALGAPLFYFGVTWATKPEIKFLGTGANTVNSVRLFSVAE